MLMVIIPKQMLWTYSTVAKTSAGALEHAGCGDISKTIRRLQTQGVWVAAVDGWRIIL